MADEQLGAMLELDISSALNDVDNLGSALEAVMQLTPEVDTSGIEPAIADAVSAADTTVPLDASGADTITGDIDSAVAAADATVPLNADPSEAEAAVQAVGDEAAALDVVIPVEADTSGADAALNDLGGAADTTSQKMSGAASSTGEFKGAAEGAAAAAGIATGSTSELAGAAGGLGGAFGPAAVGIAAVGAGIGELVNKGVEGTGALQRFHAILGDTATAMETINVGSLNTGLGELGNKLGTTEAAMQNTAASLFQFGINSGASKTQADTFGESIIALSARAVALNPSLGSVADVADSLGVRIARGGRFAAQFGLDLTAADISARALSDTGKTTAASLSIYEKAAAGAELATEKYGGALNGDIVTGSQNAVIQQRNLKVAFDEALVSIGKPLVAPAFDVIRAAIPVATEFGAVLGQLASAVLPVVATGLQLLGPPLQILAGALGPLTPLIEGVTAAFLALKAVEGVGAGLQLISTGLLNAAIAAPVLEGSLLSAAGAAETAGAGLAGVGVSSLGVLGPVALLAGGAFVLGEALGGASKSMSDFAISAADLGSKSVGELSTQIRNLEGAARGSTQAEAQFSDSHGRFDAALVSHQRSVAATSEVHREFQQVLNKTPQFAEKFIEAAAAAGINTDGWRFKLERHTEQLASAAAATEAYKNKVAEAGKTTATAATEEATSTAAVTTALADYAAGSGTAADANNALKTATQQLTDAVDLLFGRFLGSDTAINNFKLSIIKLGDQLFATGFSFDANTKAGLENRNALDAAGQSAATAAEAIKTAGGTISAQQQPFIDYRTSLEGIRTALQNAGQDTSFIDGLIHNTDAAIAAVAGKAPDAQAAGATLGAGFPAGIDTQDPAAYNAGANMGLAAAQGASTGDLFNIGMLQGVSFANGITITNPEAFAAGANMGLAAAQGAAAATKTHSPSRVMRDEVGIPFGQGFAEGIRASIPEVEKAATEMADVAVGAGSAGVRDASSAFTPAAAAGAAPTTLALSAATIDQLAAAIAQRSGQAPGRGTGIFIQNATFGSQGAAADMDFWARVTTARV